MSGQVLEIPKPEKKRGPYGLGNIRQRGARFEISFYDNDGRRRYKTFPTEKKAQKALQTAAVLRDAGKLDEAETRITVDRLAKLYLDDRRGTSPKSHAWLTSMWEMHLEPFFSGWLAGRITTEKIIQYRGERLEEKASASTVNKELMMLHAIFNHALGFTPPKLHRVPKFPRRLAEAPARAGFLNDEQFDALLENCPDRSLRALISVAYTYGFRRSELVGRVDRHQQPMKVRQIDMKNRTIDLNPGATKNEEARTIRMTDEICEILQPCVEGKKPDDAVFTWPDGSPILDFRGSWEKMTAAAGVPWLLFHDFRRSAARNLDRAGVSREVAMRITGHKTDAMYRRYNVTSDQDLALAAEKIAARRIGGKLVANSQQSS